MYHLDSSNLEDFETHDLLDAIDHLDMARSHLGDGVNHEPPELRKDLFRLHTLAMSVVNDGNREKAEEMLNLAADLEIQVGEVIEALESVNEVLGQLTSIDPDALEEDEDEEDSW